MAISGPFEDPDPFDWRATQIAASDRIAAIRRALAHPMFYDGDIGADIRWLLKDNELLRTHITSQQRDFDSLAKKLDATERQLDLTEREAADMRRERAALVGHPSSLVQEWVSKAREVAKRQCICEIDRHDFNCPVHNAGEPPRE